MDQAETTKSIIYAIEEFSNHEGKSLRYFTQINHDESTKPDSYLMGKVIVGGPNGMPVGQLEFRFPDGTGISEAFEKYEEIAKQAVYEKMQEQQAASKIIPASQIPPPNNLIVEP